MGYSPGSGYPTLNTTFAAAPLWTKPLKPALHAVDQVIDSPHRETRRKMMPRYTLYFALKQAPHSLRSIGKKLQRFKGITRVPDRLKADNPRPSCGDPVLVFYSIEHQENFRAVLGVRAS
uniref:Uncharacterized protein n=1 Tax=Pseudomonas fluorescens (strain SBW25) TaxID=216595 RepID=A0A0G4E563_PSEFS|nr:hypothetical protein PQBR57_0412 [Pseudomonas fluorescens SBW25]